MLKQHDGAASGRFMSKNGNTTTPNGKEIFVGGDAHKNFVLLSVLQQDKLKCQLSTPTQILDVDVDVG